MGEINIMNKKAFFIYVLFFGHTLFSKNYNKNTNFFIGDEKGYFEIATHLAQG